MIKQLLKKIIGKSKFNSAAYWENRYAVGGNSGDGSYGRLAEFKADFLNQFLKDKKIQSAVEMGCGDGHQLSIIHYPSYIGLDISATIIEACRKKFKNDTTKRFMLYTPQVIADGSVKSDLAMSLDVIYHIVEESIYKQYLKDLFALGKKYVIVYSTDFYKEETQHVLHRKFTDDVKQMHPEWVLSQHIPNPFPGNGEQESMADFFVFEKK